MACYQAKGYGTATAGSFVHADHNSTTHSLPAPEHAAAAAPVALLAPAPDDWEVSLAVSLACRR